MVLLRQGLSLIFAVVCVCVCFFLFKKNDLLSHKDSNFMFWCTFLLSYTHHQWKKYLKIGYWKYKSKFINRINIFPNEKWTKIQIGMLQAYQDIEPERRHLSFSMTKGNKQLTQENTWCHHTAQPVNQKWSNTQTSMPTVVSTPHQQDQCIAYRVTSITLVTREECGAGAHRISPT